MTDFILPDIGEGIVECELLKWLVAEGDVIVEDQPVAEVMTDKATVEIPAMYNGVVQKLYYKEGDIAKVHAPLFAMRQDGEIQPDAFAAPINNEHSKAHGKADSAPKAESKTESFLLPDIGEGIVECEIVKWSVVEGDHVEEDQVVVEVMTDKAVVEIPAKYAGVVTLLHYKQGDIAKVHSPLFDQLISSDLGTQQHSDAANTSKNSDGQNVASQNNKASISKSADQKAVHDKFAASKQGENFEAPVDSARAIASPAVRRLARELNVALSNVAGSGKKGRILKSDLHQSLETVNDKTSAANASTAQQSVDVTQPPVMLGDRVEAIKGIRAAMAKQMLASVSTIPHFTVSDELLMDNLIALRASLKPEFEKQGIKLSFMPFFIKALSLAMLEFPVINSRLNSDASELTYLSSHNVGMAVDSKIGLLVPSIKNVQHLSLKEVAVEVNRIVESARIGKLSNADLSGGSISISNIGAIGGITATPVINKPEVAIVALGKTQKLPRFTDDGSVIAQNIMMVNWSGDHRVIDGATMVKFNNLWMDYLAHPQKMLVNLR
ncbi:dihydrolipoyllysine-residue acetyltransferase [Glaciecola sp. SC05]|uniref:dihydrolipoyllysine-residue acetyltransferase n=1 Tax=Glaciecola sp. SC05 TaxID=1987355 RepID=UPI00352954AC